MLLLSSTLGDSPRNYLVAASRRLLQNSPLLLPFFLPVIFENSGFEVNPYHSSFQDLPSCTLTNSEAFIGNCAFLALLLLLVLHYCNDTSPLLLELRLKTTLVAHRSVFLHIYMYTCNRTYRDVRERFLRSWRRR